MSASDPARLFTITQRCHTLTTRVPPEAFKTTDELYKDLKQAKIMKNQRMIQ